MKDIENLVRLAIALVLMVGCGEPNRDGSESRGTVSRPARAPQVQAMPDSLDRMEAVFVGSPTRALIKTKMDRTLLLYGLPVNEDNYNRYGSVLVRMRQESAVGEMEMLDFATALREESPGVDVKLTDAIALASVTLQASSRSAKAVAAGLIGELSRIACCSGGAGRAVSAPNLASPANFRSAARAEVAERQRRSTPDWSSLWARQYS